MQRRFGKVRIGNQGIKPKWRVIDTNNLKYPKEVEISGGHESYSVTCPLCNYRTQTLCVSSLMCCLANVSSGRIPTMHHFMNLACCFHCHAEDELVGIMSRTVQSLGMPSDCYRSNKIMDLFDPYFNGLSRRGGEARTDLGPPVPEDGSLVEFIPPPVMVPVHELPDDHYVIDYLKGVGEGARKRPVDVEYLGRVYGVGFVQDWAFYADESDRAGLAHQRSYERIVFPFYKDGELVTWQGRITRPDDPRPRWLFPPGQGSHFFGWDIARRFRGVILVEGAFDVIAAGPSSIAICTSNLSIAKCFKVVAEWDFVVIDIDHKEFLVNITNKDGKRRR